MAAQEGTRIVTALELTWGAIQKHHPDVPDVVIVTGTGRRARGRLKWGHHTADRWLDAAAAGRKAELFVSGEAVAKGGEMVVETMLHEAAHALAAARSIRDTSCAGRWHNREYAALAREVGLEPPKRAAKVIGFSDSLITAATVGRYAAQIRRLEAAALARIEVPEDDAGEPGDQDQEQQDEDNPGPRGGRGRAGKRVVVECGCETPRRTQVTPAFLEEAPVLCGRCRQEFQPPESTLELALGAGTEQAEPVAARVMP
ncbi:hypothetical protein IOD14_43935 (plasmid) [Streptomyces sp. A2-16]|uniref:hypothetical protein n=1 Tax=Streptomyces sp. A2-16 TaxID=2781734 RepID=UPI001BB0AC53|nr:hypothetical protein [Streptomyces sp. A2-16]QUC63800.1 hypothetical protein IOD14_43935 [Streptomyces sp. A2-16]